MKKKHYLESLKTEANYTKTLNGAKTHGSTGDACLDFFAVAGGMRYRRAADQILLFDRAYIETPELAMKLLFHLRDSEGLIAIIVDHEITPPNPHKEANARNEQDHTSCRK